MHHRTYATRNEAGRDLFAYVEAWCNRCKLHSALSHRTSAEAEQKAQTVTYPPASHPGLAEPPAGSRSAHVERTFDRMVLWRRPVRDRERRCDVSGAMIHLSVPRTFSNGPERAPLDQRRNRPNAQAAIVQPCSGNPREHTGLQDGPDPLLGTTNGANGMKGGKATLHETLKRQILTLELAPDQDLDETSLSETYGISRTPVRDVLRQLAAEGYVDIRENRGARVIPMNHATLRDFFLVAPLIYEAVGRLAVQNFRPAQMSDLKECQERFRSAMQARDSASMVIENNRFHAIIGEMANSAFLKPSLSKLLIDHARIGYTFFKPNDDEMETSLATACEHHDRFIEAIEASDVSSVVRLVFDHWELSRRNMEMFIAPASLASDAMTKLKPEAPGSRKVRMRPMIA